MAKYTIDGFTTQDIADFAYSKGYQDTVGTDDSGKDIPNPVTKAKYCKDYLKNMFVNDIKAYRLAKAKKAVAKPAEPVLTVS